MTMPIRDLRRKKFGRLTAIRRVVKPGSKEAYYLCLCRCGNETTVLRSNLVRGTTTSCGCKSREMASKRSWLGHGEISGSYWCGLTRNAKYRGLPLNITIQYAWRVFQQQGGACALTGRTLVFAKGRKGKQQKQTASLDRIDNNKGYIKGNVRWVHKDVNRLKNDFSDSDLIRLCQEVTRYSGLNRTQQRPSWDAWFMGLCLYIAQRSLDPATKHGCVFVDEDHTILSVGYNSFPRGSDDSILPRSRPEKYPFMVHSEEAAIANAARSGVNLKGSTVYVTGHPCEKCFRMLLNVGAVRVIYGLVGSHCVSEETRHAIQLMMSGRKSPELVMCEADGIAVLQQAILYGEQKMVQHKESNGT